MAPRRNPNNTDALTRLGISHYDVQKLRRLEKRLQRWHELECGTELPHAPGWTIAVERDEQTGTTFMRRMGHDRSGRYIDERAICRDDETLAHKRIEKIMKAYPHLVPFVQTDPRGCALYIIPREAVQEAEAKGQDASYIYSGRGVAVY